MTPASASPGKTYRTLSIGGATEDLFVSLAEDTVKNSAMVFPLGAKIRVSDAIETAGGGAANTSVGLSRLGCMASFAGIIGSDQWGEHLLRSLQKEKVETCCATVVEGETSSFSIILRSPQGERVILNQSGTNAHLHDATFDKEHARTTDWLYLNRLHEQSMIIVDDVLDVLRDHPSIGLTWNPGGSQVTRGMRDNENAALLAKTRLLLLNKEEALEFTGAASVEDALRSVIAAGVGTACVTDGPKGSLVTDGKSLASCPVLRDAKIIDTTGAGDAFGSAATWALLQGFDLPMMLRAGTINATSVLGELGAQAGLLTDIVLRRRLKEVSLDVTVRTL